MELSKNKQKKKERNEFIFAQWSAAPAGKKLETVQELAHRFKVTEQAVYRVLRIMKGGTK